MGILLAYGLEPIKDEYLLDKLLKVKLLDSNDKLYTTIFGQAW